MTSTLASFVEKATGYLKTFAQNTFKMPTTTPTFTDRLNAIGYFDPTRSIPECFTDHITHEFMNEPTMIDAFPQHIVDISLLDRLQNSQHSTNPYPHLNLTDIKLIGDFVENETIARIQQLKISLLVLKNASASSANLIQEHETHLAALEKELFQFNYQTQLKNHIHAFVERLERIKSLQNQLQELETKYEKNLSEIQTLLVEEEASSTQVNDIIKVQRDQQTDDKYAEKAGLLIELKDQLNKHIKETEKTIDLFSPYFNEKAKDTLEEKKQVVAIESLLLSETEKHLQLLTPRSSSCLADIANGVFFSSALHPKKPTVYSFGLFGLARNAGLASGFKNPLGSFMPK